MGKLQFASGKTDYTFSDPVHLIAVNSAGIDTMIGFTRVAYNTGYRFFAIGNSSYDGKHTVEAFYIPI